MVDPHLSFLHNPIAPTARVNPRRAPHICLHQNTNLNLTLAPLGLSLSLFHPCRCVYRWQLGYSLNPDENYTLEELLELDLEPFQAQIDKVRRPGQHLDFPPPRAPFLRIQRDWF